MPRFDYREGRDQGRRERGQERDRGVGDQSRRRSSGVKDSQDSQDSQDGLDRDNRRARAAVAEDVAATGPTTQGVIKTLNEEKQFGFIKADDGLEYFFHKSECAGAFGTFVIGQRVSFQPMRSSKGPRAHAVVGL